MEPGTRDPRHNATRVLVFQFCDSIGPSILRPPDGVRTLFSSGPDRIRTNVRLGRRAQFHSEFENGGLSSLFSQRGFQTLDLRLEFLIPPLHRCEFCLKPLDL